MKTTYRVLIVEDDRMSLEGYKNVLISMQEQSEDFAFSIDTAIDCPTGYDRILQAISTNPYDLVFLDIRLPSINGHKMQSGEDLGVLIRKEMPTAKLIIMTNHFQTAPLNAIYNRLQPDSFVVKSDIMVTDFIRLVEKVIDDKNFFSNRILALIKQQATNRGVLNESEIKILLEISNGAKMKDLLQLLPLGDSSINKYRTHIKDVFGDRSMSDRNMILIAREQGFI